MSEGTRWKCWWRESQVASSPSMAWTGNCTHVTVIFCLIVKRLVHIAWSFNTVAQNTVNAGKSFWATPQQFVYIVRLTNQKPQPWPWWLNSASICVLALTHCSVRWLVIGSCHGSGHASWLLIGRCQGDDWDGVVWPERRSTVPTHLVAGWSLWTKCLFQLPHGRLRSKHDLRGITIANYLCNNYVPNNSACAYKTDL